MRHLDRDVLNDLIVSGGETVYATEIEAMLLAHPSVLDCWVIGVPDELWGWRWLSSYSGIHRPL